MVRHALLIWLGLAAVLNLLGFLRPVAIEPGLGPLGAQLLIAAISLAATLAAALLLARRFPSANQGDYLRIGLLWLGLTLVLEIAGALLIAGISPSYMLSNYNLADGRLWPVVLAGLVVIPVLVGRRRGLLS